MMVFYERVDVEEKIKIQFMVLRKQDRCGEKNYNSDNGMVL